MKSYIVTYSRYNELKKELTELKTPNKFRIMNDKVWSTLSVFIISSSDGTNFFKRVKMFFSTMFSWAKNGFKLEEEQVFTQRMEICRGCPEFKVPEGQCGVCGCFMEKKTKLSGASCPLKKW